MDQESITGLQRPLLWACSVLVCLSPRNVVFPLNQGTSCIEAMPILGMSQCIPADKLNKKISAADVYQVIRSQNNT